MLQKEKDLKEQFEKNLKLAEEGNIEGLFETGCNYYYGIGVEENLSTAKKYFICVMESDNENYLVELFSIINHSHLFDSEDSLFQSYLGKIKTFAENGNMDALLELKSYASNEMTNAFLKNNNEKIKYFENKYHDYLKKLADLGDPNSLFELGLHYYTMYEDEDDEMKIAFDYINKAYQSGTLLSATEFLGKMYLKGIGTTVNYELAFKYFKEASKKGLHSSTLLLGDMYYNGQYVKKDLKKAFNLYLNASQDEPEACYKVGKCYYLGEGVNQDNDKAFEFLRIASNSSNSDAFVYLGHCYLNGIGTAVDYKRAFKFYKAAAHQDNEVGKMIITQFYNNSRSNITTDLDGEVLKNVVKELTLNK